MHARQVFKSTQPQAGPPSDTVGAMIRSCRLARSWGARAVTAQRIICAAKVWRPLLDDVDRIARGDAARVRGTGSRDVPHRLNQEERKLYDAAKRKACTVVDGAWTAS